MPNNISFNPLLTTTAAGSFSVQSDGLVQGVAFDDPAVRNALAGGFLATTETLPMWGGVGIYEDVAIGDGVLGGSVGRAIALTGGAKNLTGFSVFNQMHNWVTSPQSQAPSAGAGMTVGLYRFGSGARIAVAMDPALVSLGGGLITQNVSWDFNGQRLVKYAPAYVAQAISAATWSAGVATYTVASTAAYTTGDTLSVSGIVPAGYNGDQLITVIDGTHFSAAVVVDPGGSGSSFGQVDAGGGALNCRILQTNVGNSKTITYDSAQNFVNWNPSGSAAVILI